MEHIFKSLSRLIVHGKHEFHVSNSNKSIKWINSRFLIRLFESRKIQFTNIQVEIPIHNNHVLSTFVQFFVQTKKKPARRVCFDERGEFTTERHSWADSQNHLTYLLEGNTCHSFCIPIERKWTTLASLCNSSLGFCIQQKNLIFLNHDRPKRN